MFVVLSPRVKDTALLICFQDRPAQASVSAGEDSLHDAGVCLMPVVFDALLVQLLHNPLFRLISLFQKFLLRAHGRPLEGGKRLGNKEGSAGNDLYFAVHTPVLRHRLKKGGCDLIGKLADPPDIFLCLGGKPQHKVQLDPRPAALECQRCAF